MYFTRLAVVLSLAVSALALPTAIPGAAPKQKRAGVLKATSYADFQVSDGVAGNALNEVLAKFPVSPPAHPHQGERKQGEKTRRETDPRPNA